MSTDSDDVPRGFENPRKCSGSDAARGAMGVEAHGATRDKSGKITYDGTLLMICVQRSSTYISQSDNHIAELTVREILDCAARFQGAFPHLSNKFQEVIVTVQLSIFELKREASSVSGMKHNLATDYILKVLGLDVCADTIVGSEMIRGVSGGQRKRVTTRKECTFLSLLCCI
ncbi:hypothetical protein Sjap_000276 [Stephania japonica]|uniref:Uncharacterized protein n=1 Tax=Stephania japonica TaxID=461633 RepID=A0AAP0KHR4_9MAGN